MKPSFEEVVQPMNSTFYKRLRNSHVQDVFIPLVRCDEPRSPTSCVITSTYQCPVTSYGTANTSVLPRKPECLAACCASSIDLCSNTSERPRTPLYSIPSVTKTDPTLLRSISSSSDEDMNVNSPDSGFGSISTTGRNSVADFTDDESSKSSTSSSLSLQPLNLIPVPPKPVPKVEIPEPSVVCKWKNCTSIFTSDELLQNHVTSLHVEQTNERFSCLWIGCSAYDKPARNLSWLRGHVTKHTGQKRFKCFLEGCGATFSTQLGVARHVRSHFNDSNLPKARVAGNAEKKCLVKKRRIKDETKALANIQDCMDQRCLEMVQNFLVRRAENARRKRSDDSKIPCKRVCDDGTLWFLSSNQQWSKDNCANKIPDEGLFFSRPTKRPRKIKAVSR